MSSLIAKFAQQNYQLDLTNYHKSGESLFDSLKVISQTLLEQRNPSLFKDVIATLEKTKSAFVSYCSKLKSSKDINSLNAAHKAVLDIVQFFRNPELYKISDEYKKALFATIQQTYKPYIDSHNQLLKYF